MPDKPSKRGVIIVHLLEVREYGLVRLNTRAVDKSAVDLPLSAKSLALRASLE